MTKQGGQNKGKCSVFPYLFFIRKQNYGNGSDRITCHE